MAVRTMPAPSESKFKRLPPLLTLLVLLTLTTPRHSCLLPLAAAARLGVHPATQRMTSGHPTMTSGKWEMTSAVQGVVSLGGQRGIVTASSANSPGDFGLPTEQIQRGKLIQTSPEREYSAVEDLAAGTVQPGSKAAPVTDIRRTLSLYFVPNGGYANMAWDFNELYIFPSKSAYDNCEFAVAKKKGNRGPLNIQITGAVGTSQFYASPAGDRSCEGVTIVIGNLKNSVSVSGSIPEWYDTPIGYETFMPTNTILVFWGTATRANSGDNRIKEVCSKTHAGPCKIQNTLGFAPLALVVTKPGVRYFDSLCGLDENNNYICYNSATITFGPSTSLQSLVLLQAQTEMAKYLGWKSNIDPSKWKRVVFSKTHQVLSLDLSSLKLASIPTIFAHLKSLTSLNLARNMLPGSPPDILASFIALKNLDLSFNKFTGGLPAGYAALASLTSLNLGSSGINNVQGLGAMVSLRALNLAGNLLGPDTFGNISPLKSLIALDLSWNSFFGQFPADFGEHPALQYLNLAGSNLQGALPDAIGSLKSLIWLNLAQNKELTRIPDAIGKARRLKYLNLLGFGGSLTASNVGQLATLPLKTLKMSKTPPCFSKCPRPAKVVSRNPICLTYCKKSCATCL